MGIDNAHLIMSTVHHRTAKQRPRWVVGILTMPHARRVRWGTSHIMKPYVDWFEERGVHVLPIPFDTMDHEAYLQQVNAVFLPGGDTEYVLTCRPFMRSVRRLIEGCIAHSLPMWGTCFGMEAILAVIGGIRTFRQYPAHGLAPIRITDEGKTSRLLSGFTRRQRHALEHTRSTAQNHEFGISAEEIYANPHLRRFFSVVATAIDERGVEYVAAIESRFFPIFGVIWHPERQHSGSPFAEAFIREIKSGRPLPSRISIPPRISSVMKAYPCIQYPEHKDQLCYFL
jgi:GMP synthase-like glutamine amidotransferase